MNYKPVDVGIKGAKQRDQCKCKWSIFHSVNIEIKLLRLQIKRSQIHIGQPLGLQVCGSLCTYTLWRVFLPVRASHPVSPPPPAGFQASLETSQFSSRHLSMVSNIQLPKYSYTRSVIFTHKNTWKWEKIYNSTLIKTHNWFSNSLALFIMAALVSGSVESTFSSWDEIKKEDVCMKRRITMSLRSREVGMLQCALRNTRWPVSF